MAVETAPAQLSPQQLAALEASLNQGSANRRAGTQYPAAPIPAPVSAPVPKTPIQIPPDNGLLRQSPVPNNIPANLPAGLPNRSGATPVGTKQYSPIDLPNPQIPLGNRLSETGKGLGTALDKAGNVAAVASVALTVGSNIANAAKNGDANSIAKAAISTAAGALLLTPNPYATAAGIALSLLGEPIANLVFPSKNNVKASISNLPLQGGQDPNRTYIPVLNGIVRYADNGALFATYVNLEREERKGVILGLQIEGSNNNLFLNIVTSYGTFQDFLSSSGGINRPLDGSGVAITLRPKDGLPLDGANGYQPLVTNDGRPSAPPFDFDPAAIGDALKGLSDKLDGLSDQNKGLADALAGLASPARANPSQSTPSAPNQAPSPAIAPPDSKAAPSPSASPSTGTGSAPRQDLQGLLPPNTVPSPPETPRDINQEKIKEKIKDLEKADQKATPQTQPSPDRFKDPKDCNFSCENLAKCFTDLKVNIFDGCDPKDGKAKTKEITIQVLPKDKAKTAASFQELLDIRSRECSLNERVLTVPEYWQTRVGQKSQAAIVYREFKNDKFTDTYYTLHIPHYNGNKNSKPSLTQYSKGEASAIYVCKDNSKLTIYASTEAEAKRLINQLEKYIDPKMRGDIVKFGTRTGIKKTTVKPIRLDFYSTGQLTLTPDWSIAL